MGHCEHDECEAVILCAAGTGIHSSPLLFCSSTGAPHQTAHGNLSLLLGGGATIQVYYYKVQELDQGRQTITR